MNDPAGAAQADAYLASKIDWSTHEALPKKAITIGDVFAFTEKHPHEPTQAAWLRMNDKPALRWYLQLGFDPSVSWVLPPGLPPYKPFEMRRGGRVVSVKLGNTPTELLYEIGRMYIYLKGGADTMDRMKREKRFQEMIEALHPVEVDVLLSLKEKTLNKFVSRVAVQHAFPGLLDSPFTLHFRRR